MPRTRKPAIDRFWTHVVKLTSGSSPCWIWTAGRNHKGYGLFRRDDQKYVPVHRWAYEQFVGPPGELHVLHRCDVPHCVNPGHLFLGTNQDNVDDKVAKGRARGARPGPDHHKTHLTWADVDLIRTSVDISGKELAERYGVSQATISQIRHHKQWRRSGDGGPD